MTLDELIEFIKKEDSHLRKHYGNPPKERRILSRTVKLMEENGELANEILALLADQRNSKLEKRRNLSEEFADVIIATLLLAESADVDIKEALIRKINKIDKRDYRK
jgi:NTP pyrophosphatase (non-canonical NTP hydrolase)